MELRILGCEGPYPSAGGVCSSYLLSDGAVKIALDLGNGSLAQLQKYTDVAKVDAFILSHLHHDHISDIHILNYAYAQMRGRGELQDKPMLFLPGEPDSLYRMIVSPGLFEARKISQGMVAHVGHLSVEFFEMTHPVPSYAVRVSNGDSVFVYSGDTSQNHEIRSLARNCDLFLVDGGLLSRHAGPSAAHLSVAQACEAGCEAARTVVTHLSPAYGMDELKAELSCNAELAERGALYQF